MKNRALLVGINAYPNAPLQGCINDVTDMAQFIEEVLDFQKEDIHLLTDGRATKKEIVAHLEQLIQDVGPGDRILFHYSGHGTTLTLRDTHGAVSTVHDAICPVDFDFTPEHAVTDKEFRALFQNIPKGVEFNWISDSCHSGDLARAAGPGRPRSYPIPPDMQWRLAAAMDKGLHPLGFAKSIEHLNGALIAGCRTDQTSADAYFSGRANGALTYFLLRALRPPEGSQLPLTALVERVASMVSKSGYEQEPQLRGNPSIVELPFLAGVSRRPSRRRVLQVVDYAAPRVPALNSLEPMISAAVNAAVQALFGKEPSAERRTPRPEQRFFGLDDILLPLLVPAITTAVNTVVHAVTGRATAEGAAPLEATSDTNGKAAEMDAILSAVAQSVQAALPHHS